MEEPLVPSDAAVEHEWLDVHVEPPESVDGKEALPPIQSSRPLIVGIRVVRVGQEHRGGTGRSEVPARATRGESFLSGHSGLGRRSGGAHPVALLKLVPDLLPRDGALPVAPQGPYLGTGIAGGGHPTGPVYGRLCLDTLRQAVDSDGDLAQGLSWAALADAKFYCHEAGEKFQVRFTAKADPRVVPDDYHEGLGQQAITEAAGLDGDTAMGSGSAK